MNLKQLLCSKITSDQAGSPSPKVSNGEPLRIAGIGLLDASLSVQ